MLLGPDQSQLFAFPDWNMYVLSICLSLLKHLHICMFPCCHKNYIFKIFAHLNCPFLFYSVKCFSAVFAPGFAANVSLYWQRPKLPVLCSDEDQIKVFPKPPAEAQEVKNHLAGTRLRLRRAGSLTLLPLERHTIGMPTKLNCCVIQEDQHVEYVFNVNFLCSEEDVVIRSFDWICMP